MPGLPDFGSLSGPTRASLLLRPCFIRDRYPASVTRTRRDRGAVRLGEPRCRTGDPLFAVEKTQSRVRGIEALQWKYHLSNAFHPKQAIYAVPGERHASTGGKYLDKIRFDTFPSKPGGKVMAPFGGNFCQNPVFHVFGRPFLAVCTNSRILDGKALGRTCVAIRRISPGADYLLSPGINWVEGMESVVEIFSRIGTIELGSVSNRKLSEGFEVVAGYPLAGEAVRRQQLAIDLPPRRNRRKLLLHGSMDHGDPEGIAVIPDPAIRKREPSPSNRLAPGLGVEYLPSPGFRKNVVERPVLDEFSPGSPAQLAIHQGKECVEVFPEYGILNSQSEYVRRVDIIAPVVPGFRVPISAGQPYEVGAGVLDRNQWMERQEGCNQYARRPAVHDSGGPGGASKPHVGELTAGPRPRYAAADAPTEGNNADVDGFGDGAGHPRRGT